MKTIAKFFKYSLPKFTTSSFSITAPNKVNIKVEWEGDEYELNVDVGENLLEACWDEDIDVDGPCSGQKVCGDCHCYVPPEFFEKIVAMDDEEEDLLMDGDIDYIEGRKKKPSTLVRTRFSRKFQEKQSSRHSKNENVVSVLEHSNDVNKFIDELSINPSAELVHKRFSPMLSSSTVEKKGHFPNKDSDSELKIPKRPEWNRKMTKEEYLELEEESFSQWRKEIAEVENYYIITPFEKNVNVWKQLWRVVEKSDILLQIVDCRNPLLFRSRRLESLVDEIGEKQKKKKKKLLLINKSDLLNSAQRKLWVKYFSSNGMEAIFFSSLTETGDSKTVQSKENQELVREELERILPFDPSIVPKDHVYKKEELVGLFKYFLLNGDLKKIGIGMVGYPNVGKSSVINVLTGIKRVAVAATPGKTKHLQSIPLVPNVMLFDCPGLVFPQICSTKSEMVCNGILPINHLRRGFNYNEPIGLICKKLPKEILEMTYGISLGGVNSIFTTAEKFLEAFCLQRGLLTKENVNVVVAAKKILWDFADGVLLFCDPPPLPLDDFKDMYEDGDSDNEENEPSDNEEEKLMESEGENEKEKLMENEGEGFENEGETLKNKEITGIAPSEIVGMTYDDLFGGDVKIFDVGVINLDEGEFYEEEEGEGIVDEKNQETFLDDTRKYLIFNDRNVSLINVLERLENKVKGKQNRKKKSKRLNIDKLEKLESFVQINESGLKMTRKEYSNFVKNKKFCRKKKIMDTVGKQRVRQLRRKNVQL